MKKNILMSLALILVFSLTGCNKENKLTCTKEEDNSNHKIEFIFKDGNVSKAKSIIELKFEDDQKDSIDTFYPFIESEVAKLNEKDGVEATTKKGKNKIVTSVTTDISKVSEQDMKNLGIDVTEAKSKDEIKSQYEIDKFKCK